MSVTGRDHDRPGGAASDILSRPVVVGDADQITSCDLQDTKEQVNIDTFSDAPVLERWNEPRINAYRYFAALYSFILMGMTDAANGVSAP